jgi:hypothetical protein
VTTPPQTEEFPWLRRDAAAILGDSRPRTVHELLGKQQLWLDLYRDWLQENEPGYVDGLRILTDSESRQSEYAERFERVYPAFYRAAGELKDAVRKKPREVATRFPWAPADPAALLGNARPKDFDELTDAGAGSPWVDAFRSWLEQRPPFEHAGSWFDWLLAQGDDLQAWAQTLDPTVETFAEDVGRLKAKLREEHGNKAERVMRQVGEAAGTAVDRAAAAGLIDPSLHRAIGRSSAGGDDVLAGAPEASAALQAQLDQSLPLADLATQLSQWAAWLAPRFTAAGGELAAEATTLGHYKALIDQDTAYLNRMYAEARQRMYNGTALAIYTVLSMLRDGVYRLAWTVDLAFTSYYDGWPHQRVSVTTDTVASAGSAQVSRLAGVVLSRLARDIDSVYAAAEAVLDLAKEVLDTVPEGYELGDGVQPWGTHEVVGARAELAALGEFLAQWGAQEATAEDDVATRENAAAVGFGVNFDGLQELAARFA